MWVWDVLKDGDIPTLMMQKQCRNLRGGTFKQERDRGRRRGRGGGDTENIFAFWTL